MALGMILAYESIMGFKCTSILADDLTGANDTAIQFVNEGLSSLVLTHTGGTNSSSFGNYDVIALNSGSRSMKAPDAYRTARDLTARFRTTLDGGRLYKKVDSVLRGNPAAELSAVMDELDIPLAVVAPSFPANQSIVRQGKLNSGSAGIDAVDIFSRGIKGKAGGIALEEIRGGPARAARYMLDRHADGVNVFVADAVTDDDLEIIYHSSLLLDRPLVLSGSAALARHMARDMSRSRAGRLVRPERIPFSGGPVLVVAGTRQAETAAQLTTLSRINSSPIIRFKTELVCRGKAADAVLAAFSEASRIMGDSGDLCIIAVESMFKSEIPAGDVDRLEAESPDSAAAVSAALGSLADRLLGTFGFSVLISTGGDTTLGVCRSLGVEGIEPVAEICPGIPLGRIVGGPYEGRSMVTKSGRFGNQESLLEIQRFLKSAQDECIAERKKKII
ncbi:MAG: hypothetical protein LBI85_06880 [Spirochaetaceae bacterium]|jgi:uncharacterized protein YgbK (DUF1537 family)|nr:hypothetical protein [Spirochaetaceae bacterium]